nr:heparinase [Methanomicrobia archaeon]
MTIKFGEILEITLLLLTAVSNADAKKCSRLVTAEMRTNALENVNKYSWAEQEQKNAILYAEPWVKLSDDELWNFITSQELPRDIHTNKTVGCPNCEDGIAPYGNYPWKYDFWNEPWKIKCPNCDEMYPRNDFYAFYKTTLDEHGMFRRELGDRSLLFNAEHPDPKDPLHKLYVDDGYGMVDENGNKHHAVAYYNQWAQWRAIYNGLSSLGGAYTLTGDKLYAHKAAVILDRIADVYPEMDFMPLHKMGFEHSHGGPGRGRIEGC